MTTLRSGFPNLRRATAADLAGLTALQQAAYAPMAEIAGGQPLPLRVDYADILAEMEVWLVQREGRPAEAALILERQADAMLVWSVAVAPWTQSAGLGRRLLALAEERARELGVGLMRLYTNVLFDRNREIYRRFGYADVREERIGESEPPWIIVHMEKTLDPPA